METPHVDHATDDQLIKYTQQMRLDMLADNTLSNKERLLTLEGISKTAINIKRLNQDKDNANSDREVAANIFAALASVKNNSFKSDNAINRVHHDPIIPHVDLVPEETSTKRNDIAYEEIIQD